MESIQGVNMMAPYQNVVNDLAQVRNNGYVPPPVPLRQESHVPPVLQQTTQLYKPYTAATEKDKK